MFCLVMGKVEGCFACPRSRTPTGAEAHRKHRIRDELPPNHHLPQPVLLALTIDLQNILFTAFEPAS